MIPHKITPAHGSLFRSCLLRQEGCNRIYPVLSWKKRCSSGRRNILSLYRQPITIGISEQIAPFHPLVYRCRNRQNTLSERIPAPKQRTPSRVKIQDLCACKPSIQDHCRHSGFTIRHTSDKGSLIPHMRPIIEKSRNGSLALISGNAWNLPPVPERKNIQMRHHDSTYKEHRRPYKSLSNYLRSPTPCRSPGQAILTKPSRWRNDERSDQNPRNVYAR